MSIALQFCGGLVLLIIGAELLVRGSSRLAGSLGVSPLVVGLTVVAFGTSAPELAISVNAALSGQAELALGNVIGSNIFNVLFILGISALIAPLLVSQQLVRLDVPLVIIAGLWVRPMAMPSPRPLPQGSLDAASLQAFFLAQMQPSSAWLLAGGAGGGAGAGAASSSQADGASTVSLPPESLAFEPGTRPPTSV